MRSGAPRRGRLVLRTIAGLLATLAVAPASAEQVLRPTRCLLRDVDVEGTNEGHLRIAAEEPAFYTGLGFNVGDVERYTLGFRVLGDRKEEFDWGTGQSGPARRIVVQLFDDSLASGPICRRTAPLLRGQHGYRFEADLQGVELGETTLRAEIFLTSGSIIAARRHLTSAIPRAVEEPLAWRVELSSSEVSHGEEAFAELWVTVQTTAPIELRPAGLTGVKMKGTWFPTGVDRLPGTRTTSGSYEQWVAGGSASHTEGCPYEPPHPLTVFPVEGRLRARVVLVGGRFMVWETRFPGDVREIGLPPPDCPAETEYSPDDCDCVPVEPVTGNIGYELELFEIVGLGADLFSPSGVDTLGPTTGEPPPPPPPASFCGDGTIDPGEACDGADLGGQTCQTLGFDGGALACNAGCDFDTSGCTNAPPPPACGNDILETGEECDGSDLGGQTCSDFGFDQGSLSCTGQCTIDTSDCSSASQECALDFEDGEHVPTGGNCGCGTLTASCSNPNQVRLESGSCQLTCDAQGDCGDDNVINGFPDHTCTCTPQGCDCSNPQGGTCSMTF